MNKKGQVNPIVWVLLVVAAFMFTPLGDIFKAAPETPETPAIPVSCESTTTPEIDVTASDTYDRSTTVSPDYVLYVAGKKSSDTSSPLSIQNGESYTILANASGYYTAMLTGQGECKESVNAEILMSQTGTLEATFFNKDKQPTTAQALGVDDVKTVSVLISSPNDKCVGNPQSSEIEGSTARLVVVFDYNVSQIDDIDVSGAKEIGVPKLYTGIGEQAFELAESSLCDLGTAGEATYSVTIDADATNNPTNDIGVYVMDTEIYTESKTGVVTAGVEDSEGADVGAANFYDADLILIS